MFKGIEMSIEDKINSQFEKIIILLMYFRKDVVSCSVASKFIYEINFEDGEYF